MCRVWPGDVRGMAAGRVHVPRLAGRRPRSGRWVTLPCGQVWVQIRRTRHAEAMQADDRTPFEDRKPFDDTLPFTRAEARAVGISARQLMGGRYQRLFYDLYVSAAVVVTPVVRARAALRVCPAGSQLSHFTAAELWGGIVPSQPLTHLSSPQPGVRSERRGVHSHRLSARAGGPIPRRARLESRTDVHRSGLFDAPGGSRRARRLPGQGEADYGPPPG